MAHIIVSKAAQKDLVNIRQYIEEELVKATPHNIPRRAASCIFAGFDLQKPQ